MLLIYHTRVLLRIGGEVLLIYHTRVLLRIGGEVLLIYYTRVVKHISLLGACLPLKYWFVCDP